MHQFLAFADKHPESAVVMSVCATVIAVFAYKLMTIFCDTFLSLVGRPRTMRRTSKTVAPIKTVERPSTKRESEPGSLPEIKAALTDLGYAKREYEPVLAQIDLSQDVASVVRNVIRKLSIQKQAMA